MSIIVHNFFTGVGELVPRERQTPNRRLRAVKRMPVGRRSSAPMKPQSRRPSTMMMSLYIDGQKEKTKKQFGVGSKTTTTTRQMSADTITSGVAEEDDGSASSASDDYSQNSDDSDADDIDVDEATMLARAKGDIAAGLHTPSAVLSPAAFNGTPFANNLSKGAAAPYARVRRAPSIARPNTAV
jgi:hypothetical protein